MSLLYLVLPIALLIAAGFVFAFIWATRQGQFDDMDTPALRVLGEDAEVVSNSDEATQKLAVYAADFPTRIDQSFPKANPTRPGENE